MNVENKRILITGGAKRIGAEIARYFAAKSAKIAITYLKSRKEAKEMLSQIGGIKNAHQAIQLDMNKKIPDNLFEKLGRTEILINNASVYFPQKIADEPIAQIETQMKVNLLAPIILSKLFAKQKIPAGCIINILDCRITDFARADGSYWLSKKSLQNATEMLAVQFAPKIRVNAVAPGAVLPPTNGENYSPFLAVQASPLKRLPTIEDILKSISFLIENDSITGQTIFVDSGRHLCSGLFTRQIQKISSRRTK